MNLKRTVMQTQATCTNCRSEQYGYRWYDDETCICEDCYTSATGCATLADHVRKAIGVLENKPTPAVIKKALELLKHGLECKK